MEVEVFSAVPGVAASRLIVLIPGANQQPADLRSAGFLTAVRDRYVDIDVALLAPQPAHLLDRSALAALHAEIAGNAVFLGQRAADASAEVLGVLRHGAYDLIILNPARLVGQREQTQDA